MVIFVDVAIFDEIAVTFVAIVAGMVLDTVNSLKFDYSLPVVVYKLAARGLFVAYAVVALHMDEGVAFAFHLC